MDMQYEMVIRMDRHKSKQLNSSHLSNKIPKNKLDIGKTLTASGHLRHHPAHPAGSVVMKYCISDRYRPTIYQHFPNGFSFRKRDTSASVRGAQPADVGSVAAVGGMLVVGGVWCGTPRWPAVSLRPGRDSLYHYESTGST